MIETTMVIAKFAENPANQPGHLKTNGKNTAASEIVIERMVKLISRAL